MTGGAGYVGSALVPKLLERGYQVKIFDKLIYGDFGLEKVKDLFELIKGDVRNPPADLMRGIGGVIHLAGFSTEPTAYYNPRYTDQVNHLGTENIARLAKAAGVERFIFASTCSVYFTYDTPLNPPLYKESDQVNSISPYSLTKRAAEEALIELTDDSFKPITLRKGTIYGFTPKMRYDLVLNSFTKDAFHKKEISVHAGGKIYRPMLDIEDAVLAYIAALELPLDKVGGKIFNVLTANWNITDLANHFKAVIGVRRNTPIGVDIQHVGTSRNYLADNSKFKEVFNAEPVRSMDDAVLDMWDKLTAGHNYTDPRFYTDKWFFEQNEKLKTILS